ncbi:M28 family peptidase [Aerolutibacter ruishenii]|uniref:Zn-dependent M28 family amino/carboxypeptidase n=1 Tax=Aerolutibacter ruishenii TaxID=686800 RepID=A0A562M0H7_9GAMM|nr:M28 family peptidase [Lysobacter ruishenii]TWI13445.1 Zn-dependent M28 family amino/carboxypeptidase [Lysobacter ruishenii]
MPHATLMRASAGIVIAVAVLLAACQRPDDGSRAAQARIKADVGQLADDRMEGRRAGARGHERAAAYVAARFAQIGLQPAGDAEGYLQSVPLLRAVRERQGAALVLHRDGRDDTFVFAGEYLPAPDFNRTRSALTAPAVFVGQAVQDPGSGHDDFAGLDLHGRIAVVLNGAPGGMEHDARAYHGSLQRKLALLKAHGAVGAVLVNTRGDEAQRPWARVAADWRQPVLRLRCTDSACGGDGAAIDAFPELRAVASVSAAAAPRLFAGSGRAYGDLLDAADAGTLRGFALPGTMTLATHTRIMSLASPNVVGRLPGRGPLAAGHVVVTAHLDHIGIGTPVRGDAIHNGALDNALGVAVMLESAHALASTPSEGRSLLFVATTAEESGLLGAEWLVRHPPVPRAALVANLNLDMPLLLAPSNDVVAIGSGHSTLQAVVAAAARDIGVDVSPDPAPEQSMFERSDQYPFVRAGIPAVYLAGGIKGAGWGDDPAGAARTFMRERYHRPGDDASQPIQYADAARLSRLVSRIATRVAQASPPPRWNDGDFFGERFGRSGNHDPAASRDSGSDMASSARSTHDDTPRAPPLR